MNCEYQRADEFCLNVTDGTHDSPKKTETGKYLITSKHIKGTEIDYANAYLISQKDYDKINLRSKVDQWDIIISMIGIYCGFCYIERNETIDYAVKNVGLLKTGNKEKAEWLYYYINSPDGKAYLESVRAGSTQPYISLGELRKFPIPIPNDSIRKKICSILGSIDNKINNNEVINRNLEAQAKLLYKSWFIDFDITGHSMPIDWQKGTVDEIIELHDSIRKPLSSNEREKLDKIYPYYGATSIMDYVDNYLFDGIYLLLGEDGSVIDSNGYPILQYVFGKFWVNNHAHVITGKNGFSVEELYLLFGLTNVQNIVTGAVQLKINQGNLKSLEVVIPSENVLQEFDDIIQPMFSNIRKLRSENERLIVLRDSLLPNLMSGELDVSDLDI